MNKNLDAMGEKMRSRSIGGARNLQLGMPHIKNFKANKQYNGP